MKRSWWLTITAAACLTFSGLAVTTGGTAGGVSSCTSGTINKTYSADVSPHNVTTASTRSFTLTLCDESPATQSLGSINLTAPTGFSITSASLSTCSTPVDGSPPCAIGIAAGPGMTTISGNVLQARNLSIAAG